MKPLNHYNHLKLWHFDSHEEKDETQTGFELLFVIFLLFILIMRNIIKDKYRKNIFEHRIKQEAERTEHQGAGKR